MQCIPAATQATLRGSSAGQNVKVACLYAKTSMCQLREPCQASADMDCFASVCNGNRPVLHVLLRLRPSKGAEPTWGPLRIQNLQTASLRPISQCSTGLMLYLGGHLPWREHDAAEAAHGGPRGLWA